MLTCGEKASKRDLESIFQKTEIQLLPEYVSVRSVSRHEDSLRANHRFNFGRISVRLTRFQPLCFFVEIYGIPQCGCA